jgi:hypothetical protein
MAMSRQTAVVAFIVAGAFVWTSVARAKEPTADQKNQLATLAYKLAGEALSVPERPKAGEKGGKGHIKNLDAAIGARFALRLVLEDLAPKSVMSEKGRKARKNALVTYNFLDLAIREAQVNETPLSRMFSSRGAKHIQEVLRTVQARHKAPKPNLRGLFRRAKR